MAAKKNSRMTKQDERETTKMWSALMREKCGVIPNGFAKRVERDLTGPGKYAISRRVAMAYLERPWRETTKSIANIDPEEAKGFKEVVECIEQHARAYRDLADWMTMASTRLSLALCVRQDRGHAANKSR
jgi:hypothetical protein